MQDNPIANVMMALHAVIGALAPDDDTRTVHIVQNSAQEITIEIEWPGGATFMLTLYNEELTIPAVIVRLFDEMQDYLADSDMAWGEARPPCPGHDHPRSLVSDEDGFWWICPRGNGQQPAFHEYSSIFGTSKSVSSP